MILLKTYDTILTQMCDSFDTLIAPKTIERSTNNVIYLIFMATAKSFEVLQNVVVSLSNKFNPASCSDADLLSIANLVGTQRKLGSGSGLIVRLTNTNLNESLVVPSGIYIYEKDVENIFYRTITQDIDIPASSYTDLLFMTEEFGSFPIDAQPTIVLKRLDRSALPENLEVSCLSNEGLLGVPSETTLEFRQRILEGQNRQSLLGDLKASLDVLPYVFETDFILNASDSPITEGGIDIPPYSVLFYLSGDPREEIAQKIASSIIYPTVKVSPDLFVEYKDSLIAGGSYKIYYTEYTQRLYNLDIRVEYNPINVTSEEVQAAINQALASLRNKLVTTPYITDKDIYSLLSSVTLATLNILSVVIKDGATAQPFLTAKRGEILSLGEVVFEENI